ncbi:MAG: amino acid ABC transporter substrate-binding protein [Gammaproteobacteria bacterium]|jgi:ABC-type amino acid transport substrate-binding protein|nr:amino acid ABC transporter substrate-binding protein [Gammaproteobacteria bacterium]MDH3848124.1 amino acid ABC transporter substrate-binding protein [Gammaproteobacteria bacterium]MDH3862576.1 amino acid ABC transporter substrate-binding protein [Gammaproteobacteria bacterium]MDH3904374.1 amino acid ABC transporter substrate-binding protein [Gammaproteobacteria bacterium]MDH3907893.1 amino acid ABC transporter substrate-binding protein [Gammaproteobacteria bacterium]
MLRFWSVILALFALSGGALAESPTLKRIAETGTIRIGYVPDAAPLSFEDEDGNVVGYSVDLCRHIASAIRFDLGLEKIDIEFKPLVSIEERISAIEKGEVDIECGTSTVTLSRRERVDFTLMTFITGSAILSLTDKPVKTIDELDKKRIAVVTGTTTEDVVRRVAEVNDLRIKLTPIKTHNEGMKLLNNGKVDGYASDRAMLIGQVFRNANVANDYFMTRSALSFEPYAFMIARGDTGFRLAADRALASLYRTARIRRIYQNWFGRYGEPLSPIVEAMYQFQAVGE